jgi:hypothetical protein
VPLVVKKEDLLKMGKRKRTLLVGFLVSLMTVLLFISLAGASPRVYYGHVVGIEFSLLQVKADDGRVSTFWCGYKTSLDSRPPLIGDRVKIEYVKDAIRRNAVTRIAVSR